MSREQTLVKVRHVCVWFASELHKKSYFGDAMQTVTNPWRNLAKKSKGLPCGKSKKMKDLQHFDE